MGPVWLGAVLCALLASGCSAPQQTPSTLGSTRAALVAQQAAALSEARDALALTSALVPSDPAAQLTLSMALFNSAELSYTAALVDWGDGAPVADPGQLITGDEHLPAEVRETVGRYCSEGLALAEQALERAASSPDGDLSLHARLLTGLHLSLLCWSDGATAALFSGRVGRLTGAVESLVSDAPEFALGAPLRLRGRFLTLAPWPLGDAAEGRALLEHACGLSPQPINHLFLGDVLWLDGDEQGARTHWQATLTAEPDEHTALCTPLHRRLAEQRLAQL